MGAAQLLAIEDRRPPYVRGSQQMVPNNMMVNLMLQMVPNNMMVYLMLQLVPNNMMVFLMLQLVPNISGWVGTTRSTPEFELFQHLHQPEFVLCTNRTRFLWHGCTTLVVPHTVDLWGIHLLRVVDQCMTMGGYSLIHHERMCVISTGPLQMISLHGQTKTAILI